MDDPIGLLTDAIQLQRGGDAPLTTQIVDAIARRIASGEMGRGVRLPAERELAQRLGVNRATVGRAYRTLEERGMVSSRVGSGTVVTGADGPAIAAPVAIPAAGPAPASPATRSFARGMRALATTAGGATRPSAAGAIDFALMLPDVDLFPRKQLLAAAERAVARGSEVLQYGAAAGLEPLRRTLATRLRSQGIAVEPDEVLVVNGIQQALDLLAKALLDPGNTVAVESPTYANILPLLKLYGAEVAGIALDAEGPRLDRLEAALAATPPKFLYTIPSFHNPTGTTMSLARRRAVLAACRRAGTLIVEDGYEEDLRWAGDALPSLAALDSASGESSGGVVYLGTFSKGLFPGLRAGYLVARGELLSMLTLAKRYSDYHADLLSQAVLAEILESGDYDRHLDRLRRTYAGRMEKTLAAMALQFPPEVRFSRPEGGYTVWVTLPPGVGATRVADQAQQQGVLVLAGRPFFDSPGDGECGLRISISRTDPARIEEGIGILAQVLREALARGQQHTMTGATLV